MVFAREVRGQELTFGVSGKLIMNALVMYDHRTDTLWSQFLAEAVRGPLTGEKLTLLPVQLTTWGAWKAQHPDTLFLDNGGGGNPLEFYDPYSAYYASGSAGILGESNRDERLLTKEFVVGLVNGTVQRAYPFRYLNQAPVLNDTFAGRSIVVTFDTENGAAAVFDRSAGARVLTFELLGERTDGQPLMKDLETGSTWTGATGEAVSGPLAGQRLEQVDSFVSFWFAWSDFHPDTELYVP